MFMTFKLKSERKSDSSVIVHLKNILSALALPLPSLKILPLSTKFGIAFLNFNLFMAYLKNAFGLDFTYYLVFFIICNCFSTSVLRLIYIFSIHFLSLKGTHFEIKPLMISLNYSQHSVELEL